jgi:hypothetical protein
MQVPVRDSPFGKPVHLSDSDLFCEGAAEARTISQAHRHRLASLMEELDPEADVHNVFIKCIKPNADMTPLAPHGGDVLRQLRQQGVLQAVALIKEGYPHRIGYEELHSRYKPLLARLAASPHARVAMLASVSAKKLVEARVGGRSDSVARRGGPSSSARWARWLGEVGGRRRALSSAGDPYRRVPGGA